MFRSIYLGIIFNVLAMAGVTLAAIKIGAIMIDISAIETLLFAGGVTLVFSAVGGFRGVVYTDFILFFTAMAGSIGAAYYLINLPDVGGITGILSNEVVSSKVSIFPDLSDKELLWTLLIIPLAVQWWSSWYPGAEPGGGGYIAQRMFSAKNESHAVGAAFFFNLVNVNIQAFGIFYFTQYSENWISSPTFIVGLSIFLLGMYINIRSDYTIMAIKKKKGPGYHIPNSFLYKYLSAPNYFGEIIEWIGWAVLTWSVSGVVFLIWVIANLFPRACLLYTSDAADE